MVVTRILDTDTFSLYRMGRRELVMRIEALKFSEVAVTVITVEEQFVGWNALLRRVKTDAQLAETYLRLTDSVRALSGLPRFYSDGSRHSPLQRTAGDAAEHRQNGLENRFDCFGRRSNGHHPEPARF